MSTDPGPGPTTEPLACPTCARTYPLSERFCPDCEMPLVYVGRRGEEPVTGAHEKARKVRPEYLGGKLVKVAWASNLAEAEFLQGMLLDQGIPSSERRTRGFDVPDFLAGGPRDILVPEAAYETARELVSTTGDEPPRATPLVADTDRPGRLLLGVLIAFALAVGLVWIFYQLAT